MIILPLLLLLNLRKNKKNLRNKNIKERYSFLFRGFKLKYYYWEFVILSRKYLLMLIAVFGSFHSSAVQIYFCLYILWISYIAHMNNKPYALPEMNAVERLSLICAGFVNLAGIYFQGLDGIIALDIVFLILAMTSTIVFYVYWGRLYLNVLRFKAQKAFAKKKDKWCS
mmetsp:Transcript_8023/g.7205  ORF Transcript_8023/g.7205 Transcript_8023/m.7205 type:complete len:169 (+) Transcript_8023:205-711(+)